MDFTERMKRCAKRSGWSEERLVDAVACRADLLICARSGADRQMHPEAARALECYVRELEARIEELEDETRTGVPPASRP